MPLDCPAVSVIIPTYNHRDLVLATLDSVFDQTFTDYEVIVINDGSPDDTSEVLRPLAEAGRIRYIEQKNTGQALARNRGIAEARGEFIALLDDDDLWPPEKLEWQVQTMVRQPELGVVAGLASVMDASGRHMYKDRYIPEIIFQNSFTGSPILSPGQALIRSHVLREVNGMNPDIWGADDWDLWLRIAKSHRMIMEDRIGLFHRKHEGNASKNICRMFDNCWRVLDIHLPDVPAEERKQVTLLSYRWLYNYLGRQFVLKIKQGLKGGGARLLLAYLGRMLKLSRVLITDPVAVRRVAKDILPPRLLALRRAAH